MKDDKITHLNTLTTPKWCDVGGRDDRGDPLDKELCFYYKMKYFKELDEKDLALETTD
jgi:hypothetical protein